MSLTVFDIKEIEKRMRASIDALKRQLSGLRTGRASVNLLDAVQVSAHGAKMPVNQVATVSTPEARMITVQVWDKSLIGAVEKAIREANIGINPMTDGAIIRLPIPPLTAERRLELVKIGRGYAEDSRVAVRNARREGMDLLKKLEKDDKMSEDEHKKNAVKVQDATDKMIKEIDNLFASKEAEIQKV